MPSPFFFYKISPSWTEHLSRDIKLLKMQQLPSKADEHSLQKRNNKEKRICSHAKRFRNRCWTMPHRCFGKLSAKRRLDRNPRSFDSIFWERIDKEHLKRGGVFALPFLLLQNFAFRCQKAIGANVCKILIIDDV